MHKAIAKHTKYFILFSYDLKFEILPLKNKNKTLIHPLQLELRELVFHDLAIFVRGVNELLTKAKIQSFNSGKKKNEVIFSQLNNCPLITL